MGRKRLKSLFRLILRTSIVILVAALLVILLHIGFRIIAEAIKIICIIIILVISYIIIKNIWKK